MKLSSIVTDLAGVSSRDILQAMIGGRPNRTNSPAWRAAD